MPAAGRSDFAQGAALRWSVTSRRQPRRLPAPPFIDARSRRSPIMARTLHRRGLALALLRQPPPTTALFALALLATGIRPPAASASPAAGVPFAWGYALRGQLGN